MIEFFQQKKNKIKKCITMKSYSIYCNTLMNKREFIDQTHIVSLEFDWVLVDRLNIYNNKTKI